MRHNGIDAWVDRRPAVAPAVAAANARALTICAVGSARSTHVAARTRCFAERGHRVFLITDARSDPEIPGVTQLVPALGRSHAVNLLAHALAWPLRRIGIELDYLYRALAFLRLLRRCRPDIVHVHFAYGFYGWIAGLVGSRPLVVTVMGGDVLFDEQGCPTPAGRWLTLNLLRNADWITSKSHHLTSVLDRLGGFGGKAERIIWGVSLRRFHRTDSTALRTRLGLAPERRVVLSPKILQPLYRIHLILEAMPLVLARCPEAVLLVTEYSADPAYRAALAARAAELGLGRHVIFTGAVPHAQMPDYYSTAELAVAVPSSDGLPQTLLEGMACGTPNLLSRLARYEEIVHDGASAIFVDATAPSIAAGILRLLEDAPLRARIARTAIDIVRSEGDLDEQASRVETRYRALAASMRSRVLDWRRLRSSWRSYRDFRRACGAGGKAPR